MKTIAFVRIHNKGNAGDSTTSPLRWFDFLGFETREVEIGKGRYLEDDIIIVGGGGILHPHHVMKVKRILDERRPGQKLIFWGGGLNSDAFSEYPAWMWRFDLVGVRDAGNPFPLVPCPSCMSGEFDKPVVPRGVMGILDHVDYPVPVDEGILRINNSKRFPEIIEFIRGCETLLTTSYHGVYWATLMEIPVIAFPWSTRFFHFPWRIALATAGNWKGVNPLTVAGTLDEARKRNHEFHEDVMGYIK